MHISVKACAVWEIYLQQIFIVIKLSSATFTLFVSVLVFQVQN